MKRTSLFVLLICGLAAANPVVVYAFNEIQAAPDSLERVEIYFRNFPTPVDLFGWQLQTVAGTCTVQTHVVTDTSTFAVLDRSNLGPRFTLGDSYDSLILCDPGGFAVTWLGYPTCSAGPSCPAPLPGRSTAFYYNLIQQWPDPIEVVGWYSDATPTFGAANDDTAGGIRGIITDDRGQPVTDAWVEAEGPSGTYSGESDFSGSFEIHPTGPGTFWVTASRSGYERGTHDDSVVVEVNQWSAGINIVMARTGVLESPLARLPAPGIHQQGRGLIVTGSGAVTVLDLTGRSVLSSLGIGSSVLDLGVLRPGVYFVRLVNGGSTFSRKLVLH
jgi:hypothetical protein